MMVLAMVETDREKEVVAELYERAYTAVYNRACRYIKNPDDAADVTIGVFVKFIDKLHELPMKTEKEFLEATGYLVSMADNAAKDFRRRKKRENAIFCQTDELPDVPDPGHEEELLQQSDPGPLLVALRRLEERDRHVLLLYIKEGRSFDRMLEKMNLGKSHKETLRSQVGRAKRRLIALSNRIAEEAE